MMSQFADVVGMTGVPEVILAKELSLCYASLAIVTNQACGMTTQKLTADEVTEVVGKAQDAIFEIIVGYNRKYSRNPKLQVQICKGRSLPIKAEF